MTWSYIVDTDDKLILTLQSEKTATLTIPASLEGKVVKQVGANGTTNNIYGEAVSNTITTNIEYESGFAGTIYGAYCFQYFRGIISFSVPNSITLINGACFNHLDNCVSFTLSSNAIFTGSAPFRYCTKLTTFNLNGNANYVWLNNCLIKISTNECVFVLQSLASTINIPSRCTSIIYGAGMGGLLTRLVAGTNCISMGYQAFLNCTSLVAIHLKCTTYLGACFQGCTALTNISLSNTSKPTCSSNSFGISTVAGRVYYTNGWAFASGDFTGWEYAGTQQTKTAYTITITSSYGTPNYTSVTVLQDSYMVLPSLTSGKAVKWFMSIINGTYIGESESAYAVTATMTITDGPIAERHSKLDSPELFENHVSLITKYASRHAQDVIVVTKATAILEVDITAVYASMVTQRNEYYSSGGVSGEWWASKLRPGINNNHYTFSQLQSSNYVAIIIPQISSAITVTQTNAITRKYQMDDGSAVVSGQINLIYGWVSGTVGTYVISGVSAICINLSNTLTGMAWYDAMILIAYSTYNRAWMGA